MSRKLSNDAVGRQLTQLNAQAANCHSLASILIQMQAAQYELAATDQSGLVDIHAQGTIAEAIKHISNTLIGSLDELESRMQP